MANPNGNGTVKIVLSIMSAIIILTGGALINANNNKIDTIKTDIKAEVREVRDTNTRQDADISQMKTGIAVNQAILERIAKAVAVTQEEIDTIKENGHKKDTT